MKESLGVLWPDSVKLRLKQKLRLIKNQIWLGYLDDDRLRLNNLKRHIYCILLPEVPHGSGSYRKNQSTFPYGSRKCPGKRRAFGSIAAKWISLADCATNSKHYNGYLNSERENQGREFIYLPVFVNEEGIHSESAEHVIFLEIRHLQTQRDLIKLSPQIDIFVSWFKAIGAKVFLVNCEIFL